MDNAKLTTPAPSSGSVQGNSPASAWARRAAGIFPGKAAPDALVAPLGWAGILTFFVLTFPTVPLGIDIDSSWSAVLVYAHQHGLQFGKDIVFTYGPLGFLTVPYYAGQGVAVRMLVDFALCFGVTSGLCLLGWRMGAFWRAALFTVFIFLVSNTDPRTDVMVNHGLLCWGLLCLVENGRRLAWFVAALTALAAFVALTKITFLFAGMLGILAIGADLALRGRTKLAMAMAGGFFAGWLLGWLLAGQQLSNIPSFLVNALLISRDYDANMGQEASRILKDRGFWVAALIVLVTLARVARAYSDEPGKRLVRRALLMLWLSSFIFLAWKHGFVRADRIHIEVFLGFAPVFAIGLELLRIPERWLRWVVRAGTVGCCYFCLTTLQWIFPGDAKYTTLHPLKLAVQNLNYVVRPGSYLTNMNEVLGLERSATQLPRLKEIIGTAPVDVFGFDQCYALFNGLNYRPRPIFQSYAAYNSRLATLNEQFYASTAAPEHILYKLLPIDRRFPALEDARLFRDLLVNYAPANVDGEFLLLKRSGNVRPSLLLLDDQAARPGEYVDLARYGERDLWIEIELQPSRLGRLRQILYQPPKVQLAVWQNPAGRPLRFRAPPPMMGAGFLVSPVLLDNEDVVAYYAGEKLVRPSGISVELANGSEAFWQTNLRLRVFSVELGPGRKMDPQLTRLLQFPGFQTAPSEVVSPTNYVMHIEGTPALLLPPGGLMKFKPPPGAKTFKGAYGFPATSYILKGNTGGAEFRIEQENPDGSRDLMYSERLRPHTNPADRGLKRFALELSESGQGMLVLRSVSLTEGTPAADLTCWAEIGFE